MTTQLNEIIAYYQDLNRRGYKSADLDTEFESPEILWALYEAGYELYYELDDGFFQIHWA